MHLFCGENYVGIDAVKKNMLFILDIVSIPQDTGMHLFPHTYHNAHI